MTPPAARARRVTRSPPPTPSPPAARPEVGVLRRSRPPRDQKSSRDAVPSLPATGSPPTAPCPPSTLPEVRVWHSPPSERPVALPRCTSRPSCDRKCVSYIGSAYRVLGSVLRRSRPPRDQKSSRDAVPSLPATGSPPTAPCPPSTLPEVRVWHSPPSKRPVALPRCTSRPSCDRKCVSYIGSAYRVLGNSPTTPRNTRDRKSPPDAITTSPSIARHPAAARARHAHAAPRSPQPLAPRALPAPRTTPCQTRPPRDRKCAPRAIAGGPEDAINAGRGNGSPPRRPSPPAAGPEVRHTRHHCPPRDRKSATDAITVRRGTGSPPRTPSPAAAGPEVGVLRRSRPPRDQKSSRDAVPTLPATGSPPTAPCPPSTLPEVRVWHSPPSERPVALPRCTSRPSCDRKCVSYIGSAYRVLGSVLRRSRPPRDQKSSRDAVPTLPATGSPPTAPCPPSTLPEVRVWHSPPSERPVALPRCTSRPSCDRKCVSYIGSAYRVLGSVLRRSRPPRDQKSSRDAVPTLPATGSPPTAPCPPSTLPEVRVWHSPPSERPVALPRCTSRPSCDRKCVSYIGSAYRVLGSVLRRSRPPRDQKSSRDAVPTLPATGSPPTAPCPPSTLPEVRVWHSPPSERPVALPRCTSRPSCDRKCVSYIGSAYRVLGSVLRRSRPPRDQKSSRDAVPTLPATGSPPTAPCPPSTLPEVRVWHSPPSERPVALPRCTSRPSCDRKCVSYIGSAYRVLGSVLRRSRPPRDQKSSRDAVPTLPATGSPPTAPCPPSTLPEVRVWHSPPSERPVALPRCTSRPSCDRKCVSYIGSAYRVLGSTCFTPVPPTTLLEMRHLRRPRQLLDLKCVFYVGHAHYG
ncbi:serine/arginine repetitive matrix protein 1-like [Cuculus canorus]|uniref:serine/arginine repetitive matrix protein 1-like n=1 Tax=Cuculus canorus TaxID=55661 RepID=UPI0023AA83E2|nr:serine/arginine repetitive matrix protein 1-like [Cuculus canorus]